MKSEICGDSRKCAATHGREVSQIRHGWQALQPTISAVLFRLIRASCVSIPSHQIAQIRFGFILLLTIYSAKLARSTAAEVNFRVDTIYGLLTEGQSRGQIVQFGSNQWKCSARQVDEYIQRARIRLEEDAAMTRPSWIAEALGRLRTYEQSAYKRGQTQVALNSVQLQAKLIGLEI